MTGAARGSVSSLAGPPASPSAAQRCSLPILLFFSPSHPSPLGKERPSRAGAGPDNPSAAFPERRQIRRPSVPDFGFALASWGHTVRARTNLCVDAWPRPCLLDSASTYVPFKQVNTGWATPPHRARANAPPSRIGRAAAPPVRVSQQRLEPCVMQSESRQANSMGGEAWHQRRGWYGRKGRWPQEAKA